MTEVDSDNEDDGRRKPLLALTNGRADLVEDRDARRPADDLAEHATAPLQHSLVTLDPTAGDGRYDDPDDELCPLPSGDFRA